MGIEISEVLEIQVTLTPSEAAEKVKACLSGGLGDTELLDDYTKRTADGKEIVMRLFERYYLRTANRATLTMLAENLDGDGTTRVRFSAGGGGGGILMRFDWWAGTSFAKEAQKALEEYRV